VRIGNLIAKAQHGKGSSLSMTDNTGNAMQAFTLHTTPHIVFEPGGIRR